VPVRTTCMTLRSRLRAEGGTYLVEILISALILVVVAVGVLKSLDRGTRLGGEQKVQAVAGNVAHAELEQVRALPISEVSNLRRVQTRSVGGVTYTATTRSDWVNDTSSDAGCTTAGSSADYMKLSTTVTWPQMGDRSPVTLDSLVTPGVRAFDDDQGSLSVRVTDRNGDGVAGLQLNITGSATLSDPTNADGCVLWGYLDEGTGYTLGFSRAPDYVLPNGSQVASVPVAVVGGQTSNVALQYDRGGRLETTFRTTRYAYAPLIATAPQKVHVTHAGGGGVAIRYAATGDSATTPLLFPFSSGYTVHPDSCAAAEVPVPAPVPAPLAPPAPSAVSKTVVPGVTTQTSVVQLPALNLTVTADDVPVAGAQIRVTTPCGTVYHRTTDADGLIDDPGFPYAESDDVCVSNGTRKLETTLANTNFNGTNLTLDITSGEPTGTCP
jgi:Tfp pilus assembly protein PilV